MEYQVLSVVKKEFESKDKQLIKFYVVYFPLENGEIASMNTQTEFQNGDKFYIGVKMKKGTLTPYPVLIN